MDEGWRTGWLKMRWDGTAWDRMQWRMRWVEMGDRMGWEGGKGMCLRTG